MKDEVFEVVNEIGIVIGTAPRSRCHGDPSLIHQSVHVLVFDRSGRLFLQKRSAHKDTHSGKWDTSVGGHMQPGEKPLDAAAREMKEELGVDPIRLDAAYEYIWRSPMESELIRAYGTLHEGPFQLCPTEIDEGRFWPLDEIEKHPGADIFTPQFIHEFPRMMEWWNRKKSSMTHFTRS
jgi:isopentenyldiphosphate isomerase